jgi:hypothetical protein
MSVLVPIGILLVVCLRDGYPPAQELVIEPSPVGQILSTGGTRLIGSGPTYETVYDEMTK